jgi:predicted DNA-binding transcriptional regulator YafY
MAPASIEYRPGDFDPSSYFRSVIGINAPQTDPERVILKFTRSQAQYIITQPIHESQQITEETDEHISFTLNVTPTYEFISMILGWGAEVEVIGPGELRDAIKQVLQKSLVKYADG